MQTIELPVLYDPVHLTHDYEPDFQAAYDAGSAAYTSSASQDKKRIMIWLIDIQADFVFPAPIGRLPVSGAVEDTRRTVEWLYRNTPQVTQICASLDTHVPLQIFYPGWWRSADNIHPAPYTVITLEDVKQKKWLPVIEPVWSVKYLETLESSGKKQLMIWPFHCLEGSSGRDLVPMLSEAITFHSAARMAQPIFQAKGKIAQTEYYSMLEPEVKIPELPEGKLDTDFLNLLNDFDLIYIAGQARSHCVLETLISFMRFFQARPDMIAKLRFMDDCTSSITGFEASTEAALARFTAQGMKWVKSTDPLG